LAARVNELLDKLEKEREAHVQTKNHFEKVEIAQKKVDDSHETFLKQQIHLVKRIRNTITARVPSMLTVLVFLCP
jgi:hypothetical protein